jgi:adenylosuccinate synthase
MLTAIVGVNWGDEGKGRMVDLLSADYDIVARYQGGNNAGHTVVTDQGTFILSLLPSGILRENTVNILGNGVVIDLEHLAREIRSLKASGVKITPDNLKISDKAVICLPYHVSLDILEEERLGSAQFGSTRRGIGPVYADKYAKKTLRMGDLFFPEALDAKVDALVEWKNLTIQGGYKNPPVEADAIKNWLHQNGDELKSYVSDVTRYLSAAVDAGRKIMFEGQLGALRDIDFGIYPYTTSSSTLAAYAPIGAGIPFCRLDNIVGVVKAYSSCVGEGPFTAELFGPEGDTLRNAGGEYGAVTKRPRRVGGFDLVASRYGAKMQGVTSLALTKLDILSYMEKIPVCVAYDIDGEITTEFPFGERLNRAKPVYEYVEGFAADISACTAASDLPAAALKYIRYIEAALGCPIRYVSVGAARENYLVLD